MKLQIIVGSIREGRGSIKLAKWIETTARRIATEHEFEIVDLMDYDLPMFNDASTPADRHPNEITKQWLAKLGEADGYVIVTPEYNHGMSAVLKNAIDHVEFEMVRKPVAIASQGVIGGARANEHVRMVVNSNIGALPIPQGLVLHALPAFEDVFTEDNEIIEKYKASQSHLEKMIESLIWHADALKTAREK